jgi:hypothetical protein
MKHRKCAALAIESEGKHDQPLWVAFVTTTLLAVGCGSQTDFTATGSGYAPRRTVPNTETTENADSTPQVPSLPESQGNKPIIPENLSGALLWSWNCNDKNGVIPSPGDVHLMDGGDFKLNSSDDGYSLRVAGDACEPNSSARDIMLVVDVSNSSGLTDPVRGGGCGRSDAVVGFLDKLPQNHDTRVAIITFNDQVVRQTSSFLAPEEIRRTFVDTGALCVASGSNDFQKPLRAAESMFNLGNGFVREFAAKELYFISDGGLPLSPEVDGTWEARILKGSGKVTIYTIFFGEGNEGFYTIQSMASKDAVTGASFHTVVPDVKDLKSQMLSRIFQKIVDGRIQLRSPGASEGYEYKLSDIAQTGKFDVNAGQISKRIFPEGVEFRLDYWTNAKKRFGGAGVISWE